jgi:ABC-2 type transport system permease protein
MTLVEGEQSFLETELVEKRVSAIVEVPAGFGETVVAEQPAALLVTYMDDYANRVFLQAYLEEYSASLSILAGAAAGDEARFEGLLDELRANSSEVSSIPLDADLARREGIWSVFSNVLGFFLMIGAMVTIGMAYILHDDRAAGIYQRLRASNMSAVSYVGGVCLAGFLAALLIVVVLFSYLALIGEGEELPLWPTFGFCLLFGLFAVAFALVCGLLVKSRLGILWTIIGISVPFSLMGGALFPIDVAPQFMQQIAHISPMFWFMEGLEGIRVADGGTILLSASILALFALLGFLIAGVRFASRPSS